MAATIGLYSQLFSATIATYEGKWYEFNCCRPWDWSFGDL